MYFKVKESAEEHIPDTLWQYKHLKDHDFRFSRWCTHVIITLYYVFQGRKIGRRTCPRDSVALQTSEGPWLLVFLDDVHIIITLYCVFLGGEISWRTHPGHTVAVQASEGPWLLVFLDDITHHYNSLLCISRWRNRRRNTSLRACGSTNI